MTRIASGLTGAQRQRFEGYLRSPLYLVTRLILLVAASAVVLGAVVLALSEQQ
jgi:hypothetical protein